MGISDEEKIEPIRLPSQNHETDVCLRHPDAKVKIVRFPVGLFSRERILRAIGEKISQSKPQIHEIRAFPGTSIPCTECVLRLLCFTDEGWTTGMDRQEWLPAGEEPGSLSKVREEKQSVSYLRYLSFICRNYNLILNPIYDSTSSNTFGVWPGTTHEPKA